MSTEIKPELFNSFQVAKSFQKGNSFYTDISFHHSGEYLVATDSDDSIRMYDCVQGTERKVVYSKKYGASHIRYTHAKKAILHASTKVDDTIRYLSLHDNSYLMYFKGHQSRVTGIAMSPVEDLFISSSKESIRLYDLGYPNAVGFLPLPPNTFNPIVAFDPSGLVFAVGLNNRTISLYDLKKIEQGPFHSFDVYDRLVPGAEWISLEFSPDGRHILISSRNSVLFIVDSYDYILKSRLTAHVNSNKHDMIGCYSPDGRYVLNGSENGKIFIWDAESTEVVNTLDAHMKLVRKVQFNPRYAMIASIADDLVFIIPE
ncbi:WD40 repeat-like protein [Rozella allomycis CSF55]|uniref:WD40 repeat-like protein n=1 Tax=Rozella allomycis (strain CSF55) TaxID=988480 RepID=A0A075B4W1_ROZAC|nr:hypothetical protein O9G_004787 [Rozella allomycis CSF55]RKP16876.1 WD40 repeat-like protein [Rozella allomycis CSF55]|eukprot:EPZ36526.1 hypothetical protein O9G_004787 [Rozella allomycis CSF55]